ncbi:gliding motility-associated C-terminal domain-containing protein [Ferruginibacter paludis]|uniref:T9SS type B sorting domain-containing protein n=1 Tax=Ferruginibacter paludis TaxID=1310417 RepID=UPI0025B3ACE4|nr:gliding motility-associated C-terminal domain-containing protein [Ferruginibacter paludis]MDN3655988.1 gliding motility-associated C-terminal domain-containing protein [Ferruginibacter paludis]
MKKITVKFFPTRCIAILLLLSFTISLSITTKAQHRDYGIAYSGNLKGGISIFGNTLLHLVKADGTVNIDAMNGNSADGNSSYDNGAFGTADMQFVDIDGNSGNGAGTRNSSSADLILPAGTNNIKFARLYWGGRVVKSDFDMTLTQNQTIKIRKGASGAYQEFAAAQLDRDISNPGQAGEFCFYQAFTDITALVQQNGNGTYAVGNAALSNGLGGDFGNYGAWSIVVVYENASVPYNSVRVYDGFQQIYEHSASTVTHITLTGLNVPGGALASKDAKLGIITWEGDAKYTGDVFSINGNNFSNAINPVNNVWNGTISDDGKHVTTKNPNYTDQMGIDIDQFYVGTGYGILPNATSVNLDLGTTEDQYFCGVITMVIKMKDPSLKVVKTVADANKNGTAEPGEVLTYQLKGANIGYGKATGVLVTDTLPAGITFQRNSLIVMYGPGEVPGLKTDRSDDDVAEYNASTNSVTFRMGFNASATDGGYLDHGDSFLVAFNVIVNVPDNKLEAPITNVARVVAESESGDRFVDEGSAVIYLHFPPVPEDKNIHIPNAFTPNDDNLNDRWQIPWLIYYPLAEISIFNRYGQLVFFDKGNTKQWDGKTNGKKQPIGAYVYRIDFKNGAKIKGGTVLLLR